MEEECVLSLYRSSCIIYCPCLVEARLHDGWMDAWVYFFQMFTPLSHTISFFPSLCFISLSLCRLYHFLIFFNVVVFLLFPVCLILMCATIEGCVWGCLILLGKTHIAISVWKNMKLLSFCVTFTKFDAVTVRYWQKNKINNKNKKSRPDTSDMGQMPASLNAVIMT